MSHKSKASLPEQVFLALESKARYGHSKHDDKRAGIAGKYIYSFDTMATYKKHALYFVAWAKENAAARAALGHKPRTLEECRPYAAEWLLERQARGLSAATLQMERAALGKLYGAPIDVPLKTMHRADIKRSRGSAARDAHFSEKRNADFVNFCRCAGPRRAEYEALTADALEPHDGVYYVHYTQGTKGGRERLSPLEGTPDEIARAIRYLGGLDGTQKAHSAADVHAYRADYATRIYNRYKGDLERLRGTKIDYTSLTGKTHRDGSRIYKSALYVCRGDRRGEVLDRAAMIRASQALGHNRECVVAEHYIRV